MLVSTLTLRGKDNRQIVISVTVAEERGLDPHALAGTHSLAKKLSPRLIFLPL